MKNLKIGVTPVLIFLSVVSYSCLNKNRSNTDIVTSEIILKGSDTELEMIKTLTFSYLKDFPESTPMLSYGGGSSVGINALLNNEVHVANSSRKITKEEDDIAISKNINLVQAIIAVDALAIITNSRLGVDSLSVTQVGDIFSGKIKNWEEVGGPNLVINIYGRNKNSGTYHYVKENVVKSNFSEDIVENPSTLSIINAVKEDISGVGYVGVGYLINKEGKPRSDVWATYLYVENGVAYSPYELKSVEDGNYPLTRPLYQYFNEKPKGDLKKFLQFELSHEGQDLIREYGYFPINSYHKQINSDNGIIVNYNPAYL